MIDVIITLLYSWIVTGFLYEGRDNKEYFLLFFLSTPLYLLTQLPN